MDIPKKISPCPISEVKVELRYETIAPAEAIFGLMYSRFNSEFPNIQELPILQIPANIRSVDPNLKFLPEYKMEDTNFILHIGQRSFSIANINTYAGWDIFFPKVRHALEQVKELQIIKNLHQTSIRYINTFALDIFKKSTLCKNPDLQAERTQMNFQLKSGEQTQILRVANNTEITINKKTFTGSVIDIDTLINSDVSAIGEEMYDRISVAHQREKDLFFKLLEPDYLATLNPEY